MGCVVVSRGCMYVCMYIRRLRNAILCLCMYIRNACAIQSYAPVRMSVTLAQFSGQNVPPGTITARNTACPGGPGLMEEHDIKRFKFLPRSLRIAYDLRDALKIFIGTAMECIAMKAALTLPASYFRNPIRGRRQRNTAKCLLWRLELWDQEDISTLLAEGKVIQRHLSRSP